MVIIKSPQEIQTMFECGKIARSVLEETVKKARVGMTTMELNNIAEKLILECGAEACFKGFEGFPYATCININEGIVHGVPSNYKIKRGDLVSIDLGVLYKGVITDVAETFEVETNRHAKFLAVGKKALECAIQACGAGKTVGDISFAIQSVVEKSGYSVSRSLAGHGVGKEIHEDPLIPCFGKPKKGRKLVEGMTLAIEVIYQMGRPELKLDSDGWTLKTRDLSLSALYEADVAITGKGVLVLA